MPYLYRLVATFLNLVFFGTTPQSSAWLQSYLENHVTGHWPTWSIGVWFVGVGLFVYCFLVLGGLFTQLNLTVAGYPWYYTVPVVYLFGCAALAIAVTPKDGP